MKPPPWGHFRSGTGSPSIKKPRQGSSILVSGRTQDGSPRVTSVHRLHKAIGSRRFTQEFKGQVGPEEEDGMCQRAERSREP